MDSPPTTNQADSVDDLLDFLGNDNPSTPHITHQSTPAPPTISNVDLFDSLCDFSIVPNANDIEDQAQLDLAPDLLCDLSTDFTQVSDDNPVSISTYEVINKDDITDSLLSDTTHHNTMEEAKSLTDDNDGGLEFDPLKNDDSQNTSVVSGDIDQKEINFDVLQLPSTSDLGLDAERFKGQIAKKGSYALRRKPSRKGVRSILPKDDNSLFSDSTDPKPEVISPESEEPEDNIKSEPEEDKPSVRSPPKAGFAMPGLHDLSTSKLFSKNRKESVTEEDLSPTNENRQEDISPKDPIPVDKPASVRVLPTLPVQEKPNLNKTGIRVLPMIPTKEKASVPKSDDESPKEEVFEGRDKNENADSLFSLETIEKPKEVSNVLEDEISEECLFGDRNKFENGSIKSEKPNDKTDFKSDMKITTSTEKNDTIVTSPVSSKPSSTDIVTKLEKPHILNKPNRLSYTAEGSQSESVSKTISDIPKIEIVTKTSVSDDKNKADVIISSKEDSFSSSESKFGGKVQLRNPNRDSKNISKRHSTNLDFRPSVPEKSEMVTVQEKRSSRNFDFVPTNLVETQKEPSWLLEMRSKKNNPVSEKNFSNKNSSTTSNSQTEVKQPSWMSEIKARKSNRVKTDLNASQKIISDQKSDKPSWMKTALDKQSKVAEILDIENKHQGNEAVKERTLPEVHLRKPVVVSRNMTNQKENHTNDDNDNKEKITPPWFSDLQLRKAPRSSPMKDSPKENIEPEWKRKAEEKRARLIKSGLLDN